MKKTLLTILFLFILLILYDTIGHIIVPKIGINNFKQLYKEKENIDILFVGPSTTFYTLSPMYIWNKYGVLTYNRGSASQNYKLSYILMEEGIKKLKPKLVVFDISLLAILEDNKYINNAVMNSIKSPYIRIKTQALYDNTTIFNTNFKELNVYNLYHARIKNLESYDFYTFNYYKGFNSSIFFNKSEIFLENNERKIELYETVKEYTDKYVQLADKYGIDILFICPPTATDRVRYYNAFTKYAQEKKYRYINYNLKNMEIEFDNKHDYLDKFHLNYYGSLKMTDHLISYIIDNYNVPIRKGDPKYKKWDEDYIKYARAINREEIRELPDFNRWKNQAFYDNYTIIISSNGNVMNQLPQDIKSFLKSKGLNKYNTDKANMQYIAIIDDNKVFYEEISDRPVEYKGRMKRFVNLMVKSDGNSTINVSGKPRSKNKYGLNMVVYDKVNKEVVDSIWIDPNKPNEVRR